MSKTRSSPVLPTKNKILKSKQFSLETPTAIFLSRTNMSTFKDFRTLLLESYLDGVIVDDEFILLYDETFSKNPDFPYEFFFAMMTSNYKNRNKTLNSSSATSMLLKSVSIPLAFVSFFNFLLSSLARRLKRSRTALLSTLK